MSPSPEEMAKKAKAFARVGLTGRVWEGKKEKLEDSKAKLKRSGTGAQQPTPGPIAMIDMGVVNDSAFVRPVTNRNDLADVSKSPGASKSPHATEVASLLVANCAAKIHYYNVWRETGEDRVALIEALKDVLASNASVLNLSIGHLVEDSDVKDLIRKCMTEKNIVVVAAVGENDQRTPLFPASIPGVLAVGAVDPFGRPIKDSNSGACIEFPGENIMVMQEDGVLRKQNGSSYATALASAAVWLQLHDTPVAVEEICRAHRAAVVAAEAAARKKRDSAHQVQPELDEVLAPV